MSFASDVSFRPLDWRVGIYVEPGTLSGEIAHILVQVPMLRLWIGVYRREQRDGAGGERR